jgi:hypothetical protein
VGGTVVRESSALRINVAFLGKLSGQGGGLKALLEGFEAVAAKSGAQKVIVEGRLVSPRLTTEAVKKALSRLGWAFEQVGEGTIRLTKKVTAK